MDIWCPLSTPGTVRCNGLQGASAKLEISLESLCCCGRGRYDWGAVDRDRLYDYNTTVAVVLERF